jgi:hypothetical protein
MIREAGPARV